MRKISWNDSIAIGKHCLQSEDALDRTMHSFFSSRLTGDFLIVKKGRTAFQALVEDFDLQNSEIILPGWICSDVFVNLFIQNNIRPVLVDCEKGKFSISVHEVEKRITRKTKAVLLVHTYGIPVDPPPFVKLCKKHNLLLIEDCAHCIDLEFKGKQLGSYGDAALFSFVKEMPNFLGGLYVNNVRKIRSSVRGAVSASRLTKEDFLVFLHKFRFVETLKRMRTSENGRISNTRVPVQLEGLPKLGKAAFCYYIGHLDSAGKRKIALELNKKIKKGVSAIRNEEIKISSAKCFPFLVQNKEEVLRKLEREGFYPGKGWVPSFYSNPDAQQWKLEKTPVALRYEKELINIDLDEVSPERIDVLVDIISGNYSK